MWPRFCRRRWSPAGRLGFHGDDALFVSQQKIYLQSGRGPVEIEFRRQRLNRLPFELLGKDPGLVGSAGIDGEFSQHGPVQAHVGKIKLRALDQPLADVFVPGREQTALE